MSGDSMFRMPASYAQKRLWLVQQVSPDNAFYLIPMSLRLTGQLDVDALDRAMNELVRRHESLRTTFEVVDGELTQVIHPELTVPLRVVDLRDLPPDRREAARAELVGEEISRPLPLDECLSRHTLIRLTDEQYQLLIIIHHIVTDAWSQDVYFRELGHLYASYRAGREPELAPLPIQYADYAVWQRDQLEGGAFAADLEYWRETLAGAEATELVTDHRRPDVPDHRGAAHRFDIPAELIARVTRVANGENATLFMALLAAFKVVFARSTGRPDVVIGSPIAGRTRTELDQVIGFFVNSLVLRTDFSGAPSFRECLRRVRRTCLGAYAHQELPFEKLVEHLDPPRSLNRNPFFQIMLVLQNAPAERIDLGGLELDYDLAYNSTAKFDVNIVLTEVPGEGVSCVLEYATSLFEAASMQRLGDRVLTLLAAAVDDPDTPVDRLPLLDRREYDLVMRGWNATTHALDGPGTLHDLLSAQARATPDRVAVTDGTRSLTYAELDARSNQLAHHLRAAGVGLEDRVGVCLRRDVELMVALYGVMKAGGAYVPLDPEYPAERLDFMLRDSAVRVTVTSAALARRLPAEIGRVVAVDDPAEGIQDRTTGPCEAGATGRNLCYVIYTSGSTGRPKGAANEHRGLVNLAAWGRHLFDDEELAAFSSTCSASFDFSVLEFFIPLSAGGTLILAENVLHLAELASRIEVRVLSTVPSAAVELVRANALPPTLRCAVLGGEALPGELVADVRRAVPGVRVINNYGVTEASCTSTNAFPDGEKPGVVPIGRPMYNTQVYVLDSDLRPVPVGAPGELYIGGVSLARGYVDRPALTADRFRPDPFGGEPGGRLYATGDVVRWTSRGEIEYLNRRDHQIKLRGFRIELGEVESELRGCPGVAEAVAAVRTDPAGEQHLIGYVAGVEGRRPDPNDVRFRLGRRLPHHLVPARIVVLDALPRNPNGKVDRAALPAPDQARPAAPPQTPVDRGGEYETLVVEVWREVLQKERISRTDNFFDIGGHSLLLIRVQSALARRLGRDVPIVELFRNPTVTTLAAALAGTSTPAPTTATNRDEHRAEPRAAADPRPEPGSYPDHAIAVVGMDCRFPGADGVEEFWANLCAGVESISDLSVEELSGLGVVPGAGYVPRAGVVRGVEEFDAEFFGFSPREAELLDPQHRVFLECAAGALQRAGHDPARFPGPVGVFAGVGFGEYAWNNIIPNADNLTDVSGLQLALAIDKDYVATRTAYKLNLRGPAVTVQTACSTSLVAVHLAVQSLLAGECDMALAGAATLFVPPRGYEYVEGGIASPDGHCRPFDADAAGTVPGSGVGVVVLRRLADALADGDTIHAVVLGSAMNNDGSQKVGYTAPSVAGQAAVIRASHRRAQVTPESIGYVEAHGTATPLGDPIEVAALTEAFGSRGGREPWCVLGSVKSNLGHLDAAAGVAGFIKAVLTVERGVVPPTLHFRRPNPAIDFDTGPFRVAAEATTFSGSGPRRAGVSSFGMGGTNVHVVLQQPPAVEPAQPVERAQVLTVSARSQAALEQASRELGAFLAGPGADLPLADVAFSLQAGRPELPFRMAVVADDTAHAAQLLSTGAADAAGHHDEADQPPAYAYLLDGRVDVDPRAVATMAHALPAFRNHLAANCQLLPEHLRPAPAAEPAVPAGRLGALVVQHALALTLVDLGLAPDMLLGLGDAALLAATLAGVLPARDAFAVLATVATGRRADAEDLLARATLAPPRRQLLSASTGSWVDAASATDPAFWIGELGDADRAAQAVRHLWEEPSCLLLDVAPGGSAGWLEDSSIPVLACVPGGDERTVLADLLRVVGHAWTAGATIAWPALHGAPPRRRPLPIYPFQRRRHWIAPPAAGADALPGGGPQVGGGSRRPDPAQWFYTPTWRQVPLPVERQAAERGGWLVLGPAEGLAGVLAARLRAGGHRVVEARPAAGYRAVDADTYQLDLLDLAQTEQLLRTVAADGGPPPTRILHCLGAEPPERHRDVLHSLLVLARALGRSSVSHPLRLTVVTAGGQMVAGETDVDPEIGMVNGAARTIAQELPQVSCQTVDLTAEVVHWRRRAQADLVIAECLTADVEPTVAYRDEARWVREYLPTALTPDAGPGLREGGVYLIVGGLETVGGAIGDRLSRLAGVRLGVVHRQALPPRSEWESSGLDETTRRRIARIRRWEAAGAEVTAFAADVADPAAMTAVLADVEERWGELTGVVHAAGTVLEGSMRELDELELADCDRQLRSKVEGTQVLAKLLDGKPLDFVLLCSSLTPVLGGIGFAAYAAANTYLDLAARQQSRRSAVRWSSINWEGWRPPHPVTGEDGEPVLGETLAELALSEQDGQEVFDRVIAAGPPVQIVVSTGDLARRLRQWVSGDWKQDPDLPTAAAAGPRHPRPALRTPYLAPRDQLESDLVRVWAELLGVDGVGVRDSFFDLGGHSLLAVLLIARIQRDHGVVLPLRTVVEARTVEGLARAVRQASGVGATVRESVLVPLHEGGGARPFFWVHPLGGTTLCYLDLAQLLAAEGPHYGLQAPTLAAPEEDLPPIEELAARYVAEIRTVQPDGPYRLGGWSAGGIIATVMARQLVEAGFAVEHLAVVEARAPMAEAPVRLTPAELLAALLERPELEHAELPPLPVAAEGGAAKIDAVAEWIRSVVGLTDEGELRHLAGLFRVGWDIARVLGAHRPRPYPGTVHVYRAAGTDPAAGADLGWDALAADCVADEVPGSHQTVLRSPNVDGLAELIRKNLG